MQTNENSPFDSEELLHLALRAMESNESEKAMIHLKDIIAQNSDNAKAHYLLGALHAELRMYDRAISEMQHAISIDPNIPIAHFQIGLLYASAANPEAAIIAWKPLENLDDNDPLLLFKTGLEHLIKDEFNECLINLESGIKVNHSNPALNNDMLKIISGVNQVTVESINTESSNDEDNNSGKHVLLSAYQTDDDMEH